MNTWGVQKKRPKKSWTSKKIHTNEFVGKNNKKTACGRRRVALRATWRPLKGSHALCQNICSDFQLTKPPPLLPISVKFRSGEEERKNFIYFEFIIFYVSLALSREYILLEREKGGGNMLISSLFWY